MKKVLTILTAVIITATVWAQSPEKMSYQAVVRDASDNLVTNTNIGIQVSIIQSSATGTSVYVERHFPTTNDNGLVTLEIGTGIVVNGSFNTIDWANDIYFVKTEIDLAGGANYTISSTNQLLSVPYALHAKTAESITGGITETDPAFTAWDKSTGINITEGQITDLQNYLTTEIDGSVTNEIQDLSISGNQLSISNGNTVSLPAGGSGNIPIYTNVEIDTLTPIQGDVVFNNTELLYQVFDGTNWQCFSATCWPQPTFANAGSSQIFNDGTITTTLEANMPELTHGTGLWVIVSGTGGSFADATNPTTTFTGQLQEYYNLHWTITTICNISEDSIEIIFAQDEAGAGLTDYDGNNYTSIIIGGQEWMAENLKVTHYPNGDAIPLVTDNTVWGNLADDNTSDAYSYYDNSSANATTYGALYTYAAAIGDNWARDNTANQGVCPDGWHLPTDAEWTTLTNYLGGTSVAGGKMKEIGTTHWNSPNTGADNSSGFSALPSGLRHYDGDFNNLGNKGYWWSATEDNSNYAYYRYLNYYNAEVNRYNDNKSNGFSVRCVRD